MSTLIFLKKPATIMGSILLTAALGQSIPAFGQPTSIIPLEEREPLETPTGTIEDLQGLEESRDLKWFWGVGGEYDSSSRTSSSDLPDQMSPQETNQQNTFERKEIQLDWQNNNRGDSKSSDTTFPVMEF
jgi:hypothetical protein